jgi:hypothetical protein
MVHEKKSCPRCRHAIDAWSRICPFCNFEQHLDRAEDGSEATLPLEFPQSPSPPSAPPADPLPQRLRRSRLFMIGAGAMLLVVAFAVGALVNGLGSRGSAARNVEEDEDQAATSPIAESPRDDLTLVPMQSTSAAGDVITSVPAAQTDAALPEEAQRSDATALPSAEYAKILAAAQKQRAPQIASVDPRTLPPGIQQMRTPSAQSTPARRPQRSDDTPDDSQAIPSSERSQIGSGRRTYPVPVHQPLPRISNLREGGSMRFSLRIGADGKVKEVRVLEALEGATARTVDTIQGWRFKPATLDGRPVEGTFEVDISLNPE